MARKKQDKKPAATPERGRQRDLLARIRRRYPLMVEADHENRIQSLADLRFLHVAGEQWEWQQRKKRRNRPCYEFNKLAVTVSRVVNEMRAARPQGKVRATKNATTEQADVFGGLIRNIWNMSHGDEVVDYAAQYQVGGGMGAWRVETHYSDDDTFDQEIRVTQIKNPLTLYADPSATDMLKTDAQDWLLPYDISRTAYEERWPDAAVSNFEESEFDQLRWDGDTKESVRICEYWYKVPVTKTIGRLATGELVDMAKPLPDGAEVLQTRIVQSHKIKMCIASGDAILEEAEWAGSMFPFIQVFGQWVVIDGKTYWYGLTRNAKDAQRGYNQTRTAMIETIGLAPQAKVWATPAQAEGHLEKWSQAHNELIPVALYNSDPKAPGPPVRIGGADVPAALVQSAAIATDEIKSVTGIFDASLGQQSAETSGVAIRQRLQQGDIATFNFQDNLANGIRRTWEILVDLIPEIYTNARAVRILGEDGSEEHVRIGQPITPPPDDLPVHDLEFGNYDVVVTVGPSYTTMRQEAAETYTQMLQQFPALGQVAGDLIFKAMDTPYAEQIADRLRALLPPPVQAMIQQNGKGIPPEAAAAMAQAQAAMQQVNQHAELLKQIIQKAQGDEADATKAKADVQMAMANLKAEKAQFEAFVAQKLLQLQTQSMQEEGLKFDQLHAQSIEQIQQVAAGFQQQAQAALAQILQEQQRLSGGIDQAIAAMMGGNTDPGGTPPAAPPIQ